MVLIGWDADGLPGSAEKSTWKCLPKTFKNASGANGTVVHRKWFAVPEFSLADPRGRRDLTPPNCSLTHTNSGMCSHIKQMERKI